MRFFEISIFDIIYILYIFIAIYFGNISGSGGTCDRHSYATALGQGDTVNLKVFRMQGSKLPVAR